MSLKATSVATTILKQRLVPLRLSKDIKRFRDLPGKLHHCRQPTFITASNTHLPASIFQL